jgi:tripartite-type tricarboxylate transporter receptor subunit TctC
VHIPYRGAAPAATALLAGDVAMLLLNLSSIEEHEKSGKARILAAASAKRATLRPDLPTVAEAGVPGFSTTAWFALFGPANMAPDLVAKINADVGKALNCRKRANSSASTASSASTSHPRNSRSSSRRTWRTGGP